MAKISGVDIRPGNILEYEKGIWKVAKTQHTQPGLSLIHISEPTRPY